MTKAPLPQPVVTEPAPTEPALTDRPVDAAAIGARRAEVFAALRAAGGSLSVAQIAQATGLHINTARFHLSGLVAEGLAERTSEDRARPGRPRILYVARPVDGPRSFSLLAEMLTGLVASLGGGGPAAIEAGRAWGRHLVDSPLPSERVGADAAVVRLNLVLGAIGFQPEVQAGVEGPEVWLHHCPFREVAERHTDVVCAIHLGLIQGALGELRAPLEAHALEPFVTPNACVSRLRLVAAPGGS